MQNIFFLNAQYVTIIKSKMMEQDGISWTIIAGVLLKHEECPSWRNMQQIWLLLHVIAHSGLLFNKQIEQLYKMSFEIPFSMSRTHLGLPLWSLRRLVTKHISTLCSTSPSGCLWHESVQNILILKWSMLYIFML